MANSEQDPDYHNIFLNYPFGSREVKSMFIGKFKDNKYHLLDYEPNGWINRFSAKSKNNTDVGTVKFPRGKKTLRELVLGDILIITLPNHKKEIARYVQLD